MLVHLITQLGLRMYWVFLDVLDVLRRLNSDAHKNLQHYTLFLYKYRWKAEVVSNEHNVRQKVWERTPQSTLFQDLILCVQLSHGNYGFGKMDFYKDLEKCCQSEIWVKIQSVNCYVWICRSWTCWNLIGMNTFGWLCQTVGHLVILKSAVSCKSLDITWDRCTLCDSPALNLPFLLELWRAECISRNRINRKVQ